MSINDTYLEVAVQDVAVVERLDAATHLDEDVDHTAGLGLS